MQNRNQDYVAAGGYGAWDKGDPDRVVTTGESWWITVKYDRKDGELYDQYVIGRGDFEIITVKDSNLEESRKLAYRIKDFLNGSTES